MSISAGLAEHEQAYAEARATALRSYSGQPRDYLIREQALLRDDYKYSGPRHSIIAALDVLRELLI